MMSGHSKEKQKGEATVELMLLLPLFLLVLFAMCQQSLSAHALRSASLLAERAAEIVAQPVTFGGRDYVVAANALEHMADDIGVRLAAAPVISIHPRSVIVSVHLTRPRVLPWVSRVVVRTIEKPIETFIPESQR